MSQLDVKILAPVEFIPKEASREEWGLFHEYRKIRALETRPDDPILPDEVVEKNMKRDDPFGISRSFGVVAEGKLISSTGAYVLKPEAPGYENNKHLLFAGGSVLKEYRRKGLGRMWLRKVAELMDEYDRSVLTTNTEEEEGHAFLRWLGAEEKFVGAENRLDFRAVDWDMVAEWVKEGPERSPDTKLEFFENRLPDDLLEDYCPVYTEIMNMAPRENLDMGDWIYTPEVVREQYKRLDDMRGSHHTYISREPDGAISGMTEIVYLPDRENYVYQNLTGVLPPYRGRGLGKWVKAAMLEYVRERYPGTNRVVTGNAESNAPMLSINKRLGFRQYKPGSAYQISRDALRAFVEKLPS